MNQLTSLNYFKHLELDPFHEVGQIIDMPDHPAYSLVIKDLAVFSKEEVSEFINQYGHITNGHEDEDAYARQWLLTNLLQRRINEERNVLIKSLASFADDVLSDIKINDDGLISTKQLQPYSQGVSMGDYVFRLCPMLPDSNSSYWLFNLIINEAFRNNREFKIKLDPLIRIHKDSYNPLMQLMCIYGDKLDWERLATLKNDEHGQWFGEGLSDSSIGITDYVWSPNDKEVHFTCEELPKDTEIELRGSRYLHAIFDKATGNVFHCDGAIRFYTKEEFEERSKTHVRKPEARKVGIRRKIFQIDEVINQKLFLDLATNFFVWNQDAINYFNTQTI